MCFKYFHVSVGFCVLRCHDARPMLQLPVNVIINSSNNNWHSCRCIWSVYVWFGTRQHIRQPDVSCDRATAFRCIAAVECGSSKPCFSSLVLGLHEIPPRWKIQWRSTTTWECMELIKIQTEPLAFANVPRVMCS